MTPTLRTLCPNDRPALAGLFGSIPQFDPRDVDLALELIDFALQQPGQKDYEFWVAVDPDGRPVGYACYGPTPLTDRTFSLYWIAVAPDAAGQGIGTALLKAVEEELQTRRVRLLVIETSSRPDYELTRRFYLKNGYCLAETFPDFFRDGEDRLTYTKRWNGNLG